jgi:hypothetical protein
MRSAVLVLLTAVVPMTRAQTIWNGPTTNFSPTGVYSASVATTYDLLTADTALARNMDYPLFNAKKESSYVAGNSSPENTTWALGTLANYSTLTYKSWAKVIGGGGNGSNLYNYLPGKTFVVHLVSSNIYLQVTFNTWHSYNNQASSLYSYTRTTHAAVAPTPTVSITNPAGGAVFSAPANVKLGATAAVSSGTVTNVAFFAGTTLLGSAQTSPFNVTSSSLAAGSYSLTAVATAAGVSATSAAVSISVVAPVAISNSVPGISGGQFSFDYTANAGLTYVVEGSSNLVNWMPIATNVASSSTVNFTDTSGLSTLRFYEVVRQPNP